MAAAEFSRTILYAGRRRHPERGLVHVLGYQNTAVNLGGGPNAMLLHLPAVSMTQANFLSTSGSPDLLDRMVAAMRPFFPAVPGSAAMMGFGRTGTVQVFEHDVYTVLLADDPTLLPAALSRVPERKRPRLDPALMEFYAAFYPGHTLMVCCFDNAEARKAEPLLVWYEPHDPDVLVAPALDCHTGGPPDLAARVRSDHWVLFGTDEAPEGWGEPVSYASDMPPGLRAYLPERIMGAQFSGWELNNGDFALPHAALLAGDLNGLPYRLQPTA